MRWLRMKNRGLNWIALPDSCSIMPASASMMLLAARSRVCPTCLTLRRARICLQWTNRHRRRPIHSNLSSGSPNRQGAATSRAFSFLTILYNLRPLFRFPPAKMERRFHAFRIQLSKSILRLSTRMHDPFDLRRRTMSWSSPLPRTTPANRRNIWLMTAFAILACALSPFLSAQVPATPVPQPAPAPAQPQAVHLATYPKPRSAFPHLLQPYLPQQLAQPNLANSPRIDSLMRDGKIYLSIDDAVALALENNLDLDIARYNLNIADTDYLRAKSGANILGVNTGVVQNTPGGGVGGLGGTVGSGAGGTTVAPGGAGTGTNGLVSSTLGIGSPIVSFDPALTGTLQLDKNNTESTSVFSPVPIVAQNTYTTDL